MSDVVRWGVLLLSALALGCGSSSPEPGAPGPQARGETAAAPARGGPEAAPAPASSSVRIPLVPGLTVVTAIVMGDQGDGESVKQITAADGAAVSLTYSADVAVQDMAALLGGGKQREIRQVRGKRRVSRADLAGAREYMHLFGEAVPEEIPGSTALGVSAAVLGDLKSGGEAALTMRSGGIGASLGNLIGAFAGPEFAGVKEIRDIEDIDKIRGTLRRVEVAAVPVRVLVNGVPTDLPAVHARGDLGDREGDFYFLDDPANPLTLRFTLGDDRLQVVTIAFPAADGEKEAARIEMALAERGRADVYGIHFDFDSDVLRPESKPVLDEIAAALREHADWSLSVEGHTDNIGSDAHNLELSRRRAAAVKNALRKEYAIAEARLATTGFGASRPKGTNETVEGRALNRRVELVRK